MSELSDIHDNSTIITRSTRLSPHKMPPISDDDNNSNYKGEKTTRGSKRYCVIYSL